MRKIIAALLIASAACALAGAAEVRERKDIAVKDTWDLSDLYPTVEAFLAEKKSFEADLKKIEAYKGRLAESAKVLKEALDVYWGLEERQRRMESYAGRLSDQDTRDQTNKAYASEVSQNRSRLGTVSAYMEPEIVALGEAGVEKFLAAESGLASYRRPLEETLRLAEHILSPQEEKILAAASDIAGAGSNIYGLFSNADLPRKTITLSDGSEVKLTDANYAKYRRAPVKADRDLLAETFFSQYDGFKRVIGEMLYTQIKAHRFYAEARGYDSTLASALNRDDVDPAIYKTLIETAHKNLPTFHRYLRLKARAMGVAKVDYQDLYASFTEDVSIDVPWAEAKTMLVESLAPMGEDYVKNIRASLENRWIDVYPTEGKRSGAYSSGWAYGVHPYVLMNYNDEYQDVLTLAHELGHALHSHYSNAAQPLPSSDYSTFVAEIASTFNENLLNDYMLKKVQDENERFYLLGNFLDGTIKGTFFRQIQFAEFEWMAHQRVEAGEALTGETLSKMYLELVRKYYGHDEGACNVPEFYAAEWAYIPHFYFNYYVFQYSTSVAAASALSEKVLAGEPGALARYQGLLKAGGSNDPVTLVREAGIDMTEPEAFDALVARANRYMDELEKILDAKGL
ncbi:MAG: oligoendopeptidase F [Deltaproteobacteria bacterium]|nr:oligoendopeptidase F [Deltaproteobacteria bacterium]